MGEGQSAQLQTSNRTPVEDSHYGGLVYLSPNTGTVYQLLTAQQKALPSLLNLISKRKVLIHPHLLTVRSHFIKEQKVSAFACGNQHKIEVYLQFPYLTRTLQDLIEEYNMQEAQIPEKEIIRIFSAVGESLAFLASKGTCHGDVKASSILFDHMGNPKLIDSYFISGGKTAYEIVLENPSSMSLLAPEQLNRIKHRQFQDLSTIHMSEMFALGLTMIEAMTFQAAMQCYNLQTLQIIDNYHQRKNKQLKESGYSKKICDLAMRCISIEPTARPTFSEFLYTLGGG